MKSESNVKYKTFAYNFHWLCPFFEIIFLKCFITGLFENGQEYQYSYQAYTLTGVREPTWFGSSFGIRGNLLIQKQAGEAILKVKIIFSWFYSLCLNKFHVAVDKNIAFGSDFGHAQWRRISVQHHQIFEKTWPGYFGEAI